MEEIGSETSRDKEKRNYPWVKPWSSLSLKKMVQRLLLFALHASANSSSAYQPPHWGEQLHLHTLSVTGIRHSPTPGLPLG